MGKLVYTMLISLDGYFQDSNGSFDWAEPKQDLHEYFNRMEANSELILYGRKMYEVMTFWESVEDQDEYPDYIKDYARIWKSKPKIVFSRTLGKIETNNTILKRDCTESELLAIKASNNGIISIGGAELASTALNLNLVDEIYAFVFPVLIGSGKKWLGVDSVKNLSLIETRQFEDNVLMVHYACKEKINSL